MRNHRHPCPDEIHISSCCFGVSEIKIHLLRSSAHEHYLIALFLTHLLYLHIISPSCSASEMGIFYDLLVDTWIMTTSCNLFLILVSIILVSIFIHTTSEENQFEYVEWNPSGNTPIWHYRYYHPSSIPAYAHNVVFIHALVGVFKKKKGRGTWGHGHIILEELLDLVEDSKLIDKVESINIIMLGTTPDRASAIGNLQLRKKV